MTKNSINDNQPHSIFRHNIMMTNIMTTEIKKTNYMTTNFMPTNLKTYTLYGDESLLVESYRRHNFRHFFF